MKQIEVISVAHRCNMGTRKKPKLSPIATAVRLSIIGLGLAHGASQAATIEVTSNLDDGTDGVECTLREAILSVNSASPQGGCVYSDSFATDDSITFSNSLASNSITLSGTDIDINSDVILDASAISRVTVNGNQESRIFSVSGANLSIDNMTITGGGSENYGSGIYAYQSSVSLNNSTVSDNLANYLGGGIYAKESTISLVSSTISGNSANENGGGIHAGSSSSISLTSSTLSSNSTRLDGGSIYANSSSVSLIDSTISGSSARVAGGGISAKDASTVSLSYSTLSGNSAPRSGGGISAQASSVSLSNSTVSGNSARYGGGISALVSSYISLSNSTLSGNSASGGGGISGGTSTVSLSNSTLSGNSAFFRGGAIFLGGTVNLSNSTLSGNSANTGGGIYVSQGDTINLSNSTLSGNSANTGGGIYVYYGHLNLNNSIIANSSNYDCYNSDGIITSDFATIIETPNTDCSTPAFIADPHLEPLANNGGFTKTRALKSTSPARDRGILGTCETEDQRGQLRDDGDGKCDVGAIEFNPDDDKGDFFVIPLGNGKVGMIPL